MKGEIEVLDIAHVFIDQGVQLQVDGVIHIIEFVINAAQRGQDIRLFRRLAMLNPYRIRYRLTKRQNTQRRIFIRFSDATYEQNGCGDCQRET